MDDEARAHKRRELEEKRKKLEKMRAQRATRSKTAEDSIKAEQAAKEQADKALLQTILSEAKEKAAAAPPPLPPQPPAVTSNIIGSKESNISSNTGPASASTEYKSSASSAGCNSGAAVLQSATGLAELYIPPVPKETYDQATNTDGPMLKDNELEGGGAPLSPGGKGGLSPAPPSSGVRTTPARADHGNGPLQSPGAFEGEDGELSSQNGGTAADGAAVRVARLSGEAAAAVLEDASFRTFVEKKSLVVERALGEALLFDATDDRFLHPTLSAAQALALDATAAATRNETGDKSAGAAIAAADAVGAISSLEGAGFRAGGGAASAANGGGPNGAFLREVACLDGAAHSGDLQGSGPGGFGGGGGNRRRRPVVALEWSPHRSDVLAISLGAPAAAAPASSEDLFGHDSSYRPTVGTLGGSHSTDVAGVVQLWSLSLLGRPERILAAHSPILCLCFVPSNPHLICGGTYAGQVVVWDLRRPSALPARRSELGFGHSHPIYALALRNDQHHHSAAAASAATAANSGNSHRGGVSGGGATEEHLVTASTDGLICEWSFDQLLKPSNSSFLRFSASSSSKSFNSGNSKAVPAAITALNLVHGAPSAANSSSSSGGSSGTRDSSARPVYALVGAESGELCLTSLLSSHDNAMAVAAATGGAASTAVSALSSSSSSNGQRPWQRVRAHYGMVTSVKAHPQGKALALSAGADWSIRLWSMAVLEKAHVSQTAPPLSDAQNHKKSAASAASFSSSFDLMSGFNSENSGFDQGTATGALLCDFRGSYDQVADVAWSPKHPALFASASAAGHVTLWDLARSTSEPTVPLFPVRSRTNSSSAFSNNDSASSSNSGLESLSKIGWSLDGRRLAVADMEGRVTVLNVSSALADPSLAAVADLDKALAALAADAE